MSLEGIFMSLWAVGIAVLLIINLASMHKLSASKWHGSNLDKKQSNAMKLLLSELDTLKIADVKIDPTWSPLRPGYTQVVYKTDHSEIVWYSPKLISIKITTGDDEVRLVGQSDYDWVPDKLLKAIENLNIQSYSQWEKDDTISCVRSTLNLASRKSVADDVVSNILTKWGEISKPSRIAISPVIYSYIKLSKYWEDAQTKDYVGRIVSNPDQNIIIPVCLNEDPDAEDSITYYSFE